MAEGKQQVVSLDELRAALIARGDEDALRRFDAAVAADRRLQAIRVAREAGVVETGR